MWTVERSKIFYFLIVLKKGKKKNMLEILIDTEEN